MRAKSADNLFQKIPLNNLLKKFPQKIIPGDLAILKIYPVPCRGIRRDRSTDLEHWWYLARLTQKTL